MNVFNLMRIINRKLPPYIWAWIAKYKNYEEQTGSETLVFENTYGQKFSKFEVYGNTSQDGTPTPETPIPINNVTGENKIKIEDRNLLDLNKAIEYWKSISLQLDVSFADNKFTVNTLNQVLYGKPYKFSEEVKEFTISCGNIINNSSSNVRIGVCIVDDEGNARSRSVIYANTSSTKNCNAFYFDWSTPGSFSVENIQIEKGSTATPYIPHEEQTVTFPLKEGQYMAKGDYLADDGIHHVKGEYVFTGQEPFNKQPTQNIYYMANSIYTELGGFVPTSDKELAGLLCTNFIEDTYNHVWSATVNNTMCVAPGTSKNIRFYANEITSVANLKAWLAEQHTNNTPVKIQFPLATETIEPYTQAQQEAYDAIKELHTYLDYTQISQTNDGLPFILKVSVN